MVLKLFHVEDDVVHLSILLVCEANHLPHAALLTSPSSLLATEAGICRSVRLAQHSRMSRRYSTL